MLHAAANENKQHFAWITAQINSKCAQRKYYQPFAIQCDKVKTTKRSNSCGSPVAFDFISTHVREAQHSALYRKHNKHWNTDIIYFPIQYRSQPLHSYVYTIHCTEYAAKWILWEPHMNDTIEMRYTKCYDCSEIEPNTWELLRRDISSQLTAKFWFWAAQQIHTYSCAPYTTHARLVRLCGRVDCASFSFLFSRTTTSNDIIQNISRSSCVV